ncbi:hypothetical protein BX667DRAFT_510145 [Coemansia mojavensis]|nr:hypothetical protein BX667DRAFT_510145 [Coemansia mojavensis]
MDVRPAPISPPQTVELSSNVQNYVSEMPSSSAYAEYPNYSDVPANEGYHNTSLTQQSLPHLELMPVGSTSYSVPTIYQQPHNPAPPPPPSCSSNTLMSGNSNEHHSTNMQQRNQYNSSHHNASFVSGQQAPAPLNTPYTGSHLDMPNPPGQPEQLAYPYPPANQPARPATQLSHKTHYVQSEKPTIQTKKSEPHAMNSFVNRVMDSLRNVSLSEVLPVATLFGAVLTHHLHHRKSKELVPYQMPRWVKYAKNAVFAYHCYGFAKTNGFIKSTPRNIHSTSRGIEFDHTQTLPEDMDRSLDYDVNPQSMATGLLQDIVTSLFRSKASMDLPANRGIQDFDNSWAVPRLVAENYFNYVYYDHASLHNANAIVLGGAAAIKALQSQDSATGKIVYDGKTLPYTQEHLLLDLALSEANQLLLSKSETCALGDDDTLEYVGKIALATIIKIKMDEEAAGHCIDQESIRKTASFQKHVPGRY